MKLETHNVLIVILSVLHKHQIFLPICGCPLRRGSHILQHSTRYVNVVLYLISYWIDDRLLLNLIYLSTSLIVVAELIHNIDDLSQNLSIETSRFVEPAQGNSWVESIRRSYNDFNFLVTDISQKRHFVCIFLGVALQSFYWYS
jgi:hypothetical protein